MEESAKNDKIVLKLFHEAFFNFACYLNISAIQIIRYFCQL